MEPIGYVKADYNEIYNLAKAAKVNILNKRKIDAQVYLDKRSVRTFWDKFWGTNKDIDCQDQANYIKNFKYKKAEDIVDIILEMSAPKDPLVLVSFETLRILNGWNSWNGT